jgi:hypothetical protein
MMRQLCVIAVALVAALTGSDAPQAQTSAPHQRVWSGTWEEHDSWEGSDSFGRSQSQISFVYVQGRDEFGTPRWESRRLTWSAAWEDHRFDRVWVEQYGEADERGIYSDRSRVDIVTVCSGGGTLELGPSAHDELTSEQKAELRPSCVTTYRQREAGPTPPPTPSQRDPLEAPSLPSEEELTGCAYERMWLMGTRGAGSLSVSVSAPVTAVMAVSRRADEDYARFVPAPGETLTFTASVPAGTARFRFELDPDATSRFPGYATNANVDDAFRAKHQLDQLPSAYANDDPDLIFHPKHHAAQDWSRVSPLVVETARPQSAAVVTVTTLDYGAAGRLRAFVKSEECGGWQPVPITFYPDTREFIAIPMDEDDNLMADALADYHGRQSGADDDAEPKGNGISGDGLTVFEEYRGVLVSDGDCVNASLDTHVRTKPRIKDLFVHTPDPELEMTLPHFAWSSGLEVHPICARQYSGNPEIDWDSRDGQQTGDLGTRSADRTRILNFTLQLARMREWRGHLLTQEVPQHGIYVVHRAFDISAGRTCFDDPPRCSGTELGPPMRTSVAIVDKSISSSLGRLVVTTHELGHAVGMPHHGWKVQNWVGDPIRMNQEHDDDAVNVVSPGGDCGDPGGHQASADLIGVYYQGAFVGCGALEIIVQNGENSGNAECPMRYSFGLDFREAPGTLRTDYVRSKADEVLIENQRKPFRDRFGDPRSILLRRGRFLNYDNSLDHEALGRFCLSNAGTGLNGYPGDKNQAGNSQVACMDHLVINDNVLRGIR